MHNGWCNTSAQWQICISKCIFIQRCRWYFSLYPISPIFLDEHFVWTFASCLYTKEINFPVYKYSILEIRKMSQHTQNTCPSSTSSPYSSSAALSEGRAEIFSPELRWWHENNGVECWHCLQLWELTISVVFVCERLLDLRSIAFSADLFTDYADVKNLNVFREYVNDDYDCHTCSTHTFPRSPRAQMVSKCKWNTTKQ